MKYLTSILFAATLAVAAPASNHTLEQRSFQGSINWFDRWDCQKYCVEIGMCLAGQVSLGVEGSEDQWIGCDNGWWDRPDKVKSLALSVFNGPRFSGINKSCKEWKVDNFNAETYALESGSKYGHDACNLFKHEHIKAVFNHWT